MDCTKMTFIVLFQFSMMYIRNNKQFLLFLLLFVVTVNAALFISRAYYFKDFAMLSGYKPNWFYMFSRANGKTTIDFAHFLIFEYRILFQKQRFCFLFSSSFLCKRVAQNDLTQRFSPLHGGEEGKKR